jgi:hypothetical protein
VRRSITANALIASIGLVLGAQLHAQNVQASAKPLRVFVDCNAQGCDLDFFRTEIPYVDYVRDRTDASVHLLVSTQPTASGGVEHTLNFIGRREFAGLSDTLLYLAPQSSTTDELRRTRADPQAGTCPLHCANPAA